VVETKDQRRYITHGGEFQYLVAARAKVRQKVIVLVSGEADAATLLRVAPTRSLIVALQAPGAPGVLEILRPPGALEVLDALGDLEVLGK